ncbi:MAG: nucleotidyl transferase AbiEii/AbiGii toxin family protein [Candidatus Omnitrophica bacterium]|nr:nucleotidyl transferase AbiEii/AbiGii toxin family protein [Candidatus Omnitrophota bacterium]MDO9572927.1 nucleotidyl transferase AbiEii/AbiGii toxin family protein [Candidatus Omnitrophota bacterium]
MSGDNYSELQIREVFHLEFLRYFGRKVKPACYALKGGVNLRLFFNSIRYSEDMDLDIEKVEVSWLKDYVMDILRMPAFQEHLLPFGIKQIIPPAIERAKQTQTTQRFKIHLITYADINLFTKVEFSRRGITGNSVVQTPLDSILRVYKIAPVLVSHYDIYSAVIQKIKALAGRTVIQARDIFDLYLLNSQFVANSKRKAIPMEKVVFSKAYEHVFQVKFEVFRDTVVAYLTPEDRLVYDNPSVWEQIQLKTAGFIEQLGKDYA